MSVRDEPTETGAKLMRSPLSDTVYLVTEWVPGPDGHHRAVEKEAVSEPPHDYTLDPEAIDGSAYPRGPLGDEPAENRPTVAIGFCSKCGANARASTTVRGLFRCFECGYQWSDSRVGEQTREFEDYFTKQ